MIPGLWIAEKTLAGWLLPGTLVLLVFLVILVVALRQSRPAPSMRPDDAQEPDSDHNVRWQGSNGNHLPEYSSCYERPVFLLLGPANSGQSAILDALEDALTKDAIRESGIARLEHGTVLEADSNFFARASNGNGAENEWKKYIDHLQRRRPQRPLDGVVLTLPCQDFAGEHAQSGEQLEQRAAQMSKDLLLLRDRLGFSFPVYVLITKCDEMRGFQEFAAGQLLSHKREIVGWSNPYNLDAPFDPRWIHQAFSHTHQEIEEQRIYFFARDQNGIKGFDSLSQDELFLFPARLRELEAPVSDFLSSLFRDAGHRDALQFRGLYFSGDAQTKNGNTAETQTNHAGMAEFTADLFEHKIFSERGLAHPVDSELVPRNRELYLAKGLFWVTSAVLFSGTAMGWHSLSHIRDKALTRMERVTRAMRVAPEEPQAEPAYDAIYAAQALSGENFRSFFLPFSFLPELDLTVRKAMPDVFDKLVYPGLHFELENRADDLLRESSRCQGEQGEEVLPMAPECLPYATASQQLSAFINGGDSPGEYGLLSLEDNIALFNRLTPDGAGNGRDIVTLASNLAPMKFADVPHKPGATMDAIVAGSHGVLPLDGGTWKTLAVSRIEAMITQVLRQRMDEDQLLATVTATMDQINRLEAKELDTNEQLNGLNKSLGLVQNQLAAPDLEWVAKNEYQLPPDINQALTPVFERAPQQNVLLCDGKTETESCPGLIHLRLFVWPAAHTHSLDLRTKLLSTRTNITGDLIVGTDGKLQLSPGALRLQTSLDGFLKLPFVEHEGTGQIQDVPAGQQLFWNSSKLQEALLNKAAYDKFLSEDLGNTADSLQDALEDLALDRLEPSMMDAIASAQQFETLPPGDKADQGTTAEAQAFATSAQPLTQLLDQFSELGFEDDYQDLLRVNTDHALMVLSRIDRYFDSRSFYWPPANNFDSWTGDTPPSTAAYATHSLDEMLSYLTIQRQDLQPYVAAAKPLATFLQQRGPRNPKQSALIAKWLGIVNDVQKYESAPASSSLGSLENYLAIEMDKTGPPDCQTAASPTVPVYFALTQRALTRAVSARCRCLGRQSGNTQYSQLAQFFDEHLACRFPFSNSSCESLREAEPTDVVELFRLLDAGGKSVHDAVQSNSGPASAQMVFVNQLEALRPIFASLLSAQPDQAPAWDFVPVFRANRGHEINGNQIMDWTFVAGNAVFRNSDPQKVGHWSFGQPVTLSLRWAKDSPTRPIAGTPANNYPDTRTVVYEYHDRWALLRMLTEHAAPTTDFDRKVDPDPQTLAFTIGQQVVPGPAPKGGLSLPPGNQTPGPDVKVFVSIRLYAPGKTTSLPLPAFPVRAPAP
jgi:type VI secretion system protein ImpL